MKKENKMALIFNFKFLRCMSFVVTFSLTCFSNFCYAQYLSGPVARSLGGAGRGAADDGEQILLNPAGLVHGSPFTSSVFYQDGYWAKGEHESSLGFGLADNSEELIFAGSYVFDKARKTFVGQKTREEQYHQISLARFIFPHISTGMTLTFLQTHLIGGNDYTQWNSHLGFLYNPVSEIGIGLIFYNFAAKDEKIPVEIRNLNSISTGLNYIFMPNFRARVDVTTRESLNPDNKLKYDMGIESKLTEMFTTRIGYQKDGFLNRNFYTLGLCFDGPRLKIDYSYVKNSDYSDGAMHGVDLRMPFW